MKLHTIIILYSLLQSVTYAATDKPDVYRVGAAALWHSEVYQATGSEVRLLPALYVKSGRWEFKFKTLKYHLINTEQFNLAPILDLDFNGYEADDSPYLAGMADRDFSVGLGLAADMRLGLIDIEASVQQDVTNHSDGLTANLALGMTRPITRQVIAGIKLDATYQDSDYSNYYYGVLSNEAKITRPAYTLGSTINPSLQLNVIYRLNRSWSVNSSVIYTQLDGDIENSPIVEHGNETTILLGISYQGLL